MRKNVFGRRFKRDVNERKAMFKGLMSSLVLKESIKTTEEKAKAIKGSVDKLITRAKKGGNLARLLSPYLTEEAFKKLVNEVAPRFKKRNGGYTRIIKMGRRFSDNAVMVLMEWTEKPSVDVKELSVSDSSVPSVVAKKVSKNKKTVTTKTQKKRETLKKRRVLK